MSSWFAQRNAILATMHGKEQVIAPVLESALGLQVTVPTAFNTDTFGTFTREVARPADQVTTARMKAQAALQQTGATIAIASEGSFGPHPALPLLPCDRELVILIDQEHDFEIVGEAISTATNFSHRAIATVNEALAFAAKIGFPEHGLIATLDPDGQDTTYLVKGIRTEADLIATVEDLLNLCDRVHLETDMRAMHNPSRMAVIRAAAENLVHKATSLCPECQTPGFSIVENLPGLPCALCQQPTNQLLSVIYACQQCHFRDPVLFLNQIEFADPGSCNFCNP